MPAKYYGNRTTRVLHNSNKKDACRMSEIKSSNRERFTSFREAESEGYRFCKICFKDVAETK